MTEMPRIEIVFNFDVVARFCIILVSFAVFSSQSDAT